MTFCLQMFAFIKNYILSYPLGTIYMNDFTSEVSYLYFTYV